VVEVKVEGAALRTDRLSIEENQAGIGVALGVAGDGHKLPFSLYLAILFKVHRMSLLGLHSAPFDPPLRGLLVQSRPSSDRMSLSGSLALLLGSGTSPVNY